MLFYFSFSYSQRILISDVESCPVASKLKYESTQDRLLYETLMECMNAFEGTQECLKLIKEIYDPPKSCDSQGKAMTDTMPVTQLISETLGAIFGINDFVELALTANYFDETTLQQHRDSLALYQDLNFDELVRMKVYDCNYVHRGIIQSISLITHMCVLMLHRYYMIKIENSEIYTNDRKGFINGIRKYLKYDSVYLETILERRRDVIPFNISTKDIFDSSYSVQDILIFINRNVMPGDIVFLSYSLVEIYAEIEEKLKGQKNVESASIEDILDTIVKNSILYKVWTAHQNDIIKHGSLRIILREETKFEKFWIVDKRCDTFDKWQYFVLAREHRIAQIRDAIKRIFYANCT